MPIIPTATSHLGHSVSSQIQKAESPQQELIQALSRRNPKSQESLHVLHFGEGFPLPFRSSPPPLGSAAGGGGRGAVEGEGGPEGQIVILRLRLLFQSPERRHRTPHA